MITIVDYGMGNIRSVMNALSFLGADSELTADSQRILKANKVILPGVGSFGAAMARLNELKLVAVLREIVLKRGTPMLGICLGMQLLAEQGDEHGPCNGLGLIPGCVRHINKAAPDLIVPHIGFNTLEHRRKGNLLSELEGELDYYFVHSYQFETDDAYVVAITEYCGTNLTAVVESGCAYGVQFHPEKSQSNGLKLLKNFIDMRAC